MSDNWWTTEDVAEFLEITPQQVYESRRRSEYPGVLGQRRGRSLAFLRSQVEAGPQEPKITNDPTEALLWTAQGIEAKLGELLDLARAQARARLAQPHMTEDENEMAKAIIEARRIADNE